MNEILNTVRLALRITTEAFDVELTNMINAGMSDLGIAGVNGENVALTDPLTMQAIITYCKMNFGEPDEYDRLKKSYDEQKAQMSMATGWTTWTGQTC